MADKQMIFGIATRIDLLNFIMANQELEGRPLSPKWKSVHFTAQGLKSQLLSSKGLKTLHRNSLFVI